MAWHPTSLWHSGELNFLSLFSKERYVQLCSLILQTAFQEALVLVPTEAYPFLPPSTQTGSAACRILDLNVIQSECLLLRYAGYITCTKFEKTAGEVTRVEATFEAFDKRKPPKVNFQACRPSEKTTINILSAALPCPKKAAEPMNPTYKSKRHIGWKIPTCTWGSQGAISLDCWPTATSLLD